MNLEAELVFTHRWRKGGVRVFRVFDDAHIDTYSLAKGFGSLDVYLKHGFSQLMIGVGVYYTSTKSKVIYRLDADIKERYGIDYEFAPHLSMFPDWELPRWLDSRRPPSRDEVKRQRANTRAGAIEL